MFVVCLFLPILFHEVQAICLNIAHRVYQTLTWKASDRENLTTAKKKKTRFAVSASEIIR